MPSNYTIEHSKFLFEYLDTGKAQYCYRDEDNHAKVFKLTDGRFVLVPALKANEVVVFESEEDMNTIVKDIGVPIEDPRPNLFQKKQEFILKIETSSKDLISQLGTEIGFNLDSKEYADISFQFRKFFYRTDYQERLEQYKFPLGIYVHELIRKEVKGNWWLIKRYAINPYYIPVIESPEGLKFNAWRSVSRSLKMTQMFDLERVVHQADCEPRNKRIRIELK